MVLEKAYAKLYSGYWNIGHGGLPFRALKDLTGAPSEHHLITKKTNKDELWEHIKDCDEQNYMMAAGSSDQFLKKNGIDGGHAYTLIGAHLLNGDRVLELRNPWGNGEWDGKWGDEDIAWTAELKRKHHPQGAKNDGRFFMPLNQFVRHFASYDICYYKDSYTLSSFLDELDNEFIGCYKAEVSVPGEYFVCLSQLDRHTFYNPHIPRSKN